MVRRQAFASLMLIVAVTPLASQAQTPAPKGEPTRFLIRAGRLVDPRGGRVLEDQAIRVEGERIEAVGPFAEVGAATPKTYRLIDLSRATVLPGLIDAHTHVPASPGWSASSS